MRRWISLCVCLLLAATSAAGEVRLWVVNPCSEPSLAPATAPAPKGQADGPLAVQGADAADAWQGRLYILGTFKPLVAARVTLGAGEAKPRMAAVADGAGITVTTDRGSWHFARDGRTAFTAREGGTAVLRQAVSRLPRVAYAGAALVALRLDAQGVDYRVFRNGLLEVAATRPLKLSWAAALPREASLAATLGFALADGVGTMAEPLDWVRIGAKPSLHVGQLTGSNSLGPWEVSLAGAVRIVPGGADAWASVRTQAALGHLAVLDDQLTGSSPAFDGRITVEDRDGDKTPDFDSDLWLLDARADGGLDLVLNCVQTRDDADGEPDSVFVYEPKGKPRAGLKLLVGAEGRDRYSGTPFEAEAATEVKAAGLQPALVLEDWNDDGRFLVGSLLRGGYLHQDRVLHGRGREARAFDLDGDGDVDVADWIDSTQLDLEDVFIGLMRITLDPAAGRAAIHPFTPRDSVTMARANVSWYNKTYLGGRYHKGARLGFEEHMSICVPPCRELPDGGMFHFKTTDDNIDRMTMGRFTRTGIIAWNLELDPLEADREHPDRYKHVAHYTDPWGHEFKARTLVYPPKWDGRRLEWEPRPQHGNAWEIYPNAPWYRMTTGKVLPLRGIHAAFTPEGYSYGSNEGMYGGALSHLERLEDNTDGADFTLYYSTLLGGLHLKGADYGHVATPVGYPGHPFHRKEWYHFPNAFLEPEARGQGKRSIFHPEGKRLEGPLFFHYIDQDKDGYFDTYIYDADNDGVVDKSLWYDAKGRFVVMQQGERRAAWPYAAEFTDVAYQFANYEKVRQLWRRGLREEALIERFSLASSGVPVERQTYRETRETPPELETTRRWRPDFFAIFSPEWTPRIAALEEPESPDRYGWTDFKPTGFTRTGSVAALAGLAQTTVRGEITADALRGVAILLVGHLSHVPSERELAALLAWVEQGGAAVLHYTSEDPVDRLYLNALGKRLGFTLGGLVENRTVVRKLGTLGSFTDTTAPFVEERQVTPGNRIEHYADAAGWGLLDGLSHISFVGCPMTLEKPMTPVLAYKGKPIIAQAAFGRGLILVCGVNALSDAHTRHNERPEPGTQNGLLLQRIVRKLAARAPGPVVRSCRYAAGNARAKPPVAGRAAIVLDGPGGTVLFPQLWAKRGVTLDGKAVVPRAAGALSALALEPGPHTIEIVQQIEGKQ